ncbi:MAG: VanZ family protein [Snodgrassella sp.]|jgi:VanZ family protein|nr:VanZ family protein [Snodgrassella sp.]
MKAVWSNKWFFLSVVWFIASIYSLFFASGNHLSSIRHFDKICHCGLFFGQFWLLCKICLSNGIHIPIRAFLAFALLWACTSEVIQLQLPKRNGDILDAIADLLGAVCAIWIAKKIQLARYSRCKGTKHGT